MARIYATKGDNAKTKPVTIPMAPALFDRLRQHAEATKTTATAAARELIEQGLQREPQEARK